MEFEKEMKNFIKCGLKDDAHKKQTIRAACYIIATLNAHYNKKLSKDDIEKVVGGINFSDTGDGISWGIN